MPQLGLVIDLNRCVGCHTCSVSCRAAWSVPLPHQRNWVRRLGPDNTPYGLAHTFYPGQCNHCEKPECIKVCPVDPAEKYIQDPVSGGSQMIMASALWKNPFTGVVSTDRQRCIGCGACVKACPYDARYLDTSGPQAIADGCTFCQETPEEQPVCVQKCMTGARIFGDINDAKSQVAGYIANGAIRLESQDVAIGSNVYYFGPAKDLALLQATSLPEKKPPVSGRRALLSKLLP